MGSNVSNRSIAVDDSGNVYVTGTSNNIDSTITIKYNASGVQQWATIHTSPYGGEDEGNVLKIGASGNIYVGGSTRPPSGYTNYIHVLKYNRDGNLLWEKNFEGGTSYWCLC